MFQKTTKTATNAGEFPGKCSTKTPKQQQMPEIFRQMFHKNAKTTTNAGDFPANVPKNHQNSNIFRRKNSGKCSTSTLKLARIATRSLRNSRWKSPGLPT
ncbi:hypothetical protein [Gardnerella vaginalis]|uniref:hypothetical protein n=1 Tax=Gardnerella vaginalis TaxID=2702 RepID=UPI00140416C2|nr:hypothetical protein [Gardnerella vaginalis]